MSATPAAIMQLQQAFLSGRLQGDELRSVRENAPRFVDMLCEGLKLRGPSDLQRIADRGELTVEKIARAMQ